MAHWAAVRANAIARMWIVTILIVLVAGCGVETNVERLREAERLTSDILVLLSNATDASNRAVMAGTGESASEFSTEADQGIQTVQRDSAHLKQLLAALGYSDELRVFEEFVHRFAEYRDLDREIRDLAVENTNVKAQRLSFGPAQKEVDAFRDALDAVARGYTGRDSWQVKALCATALSAVREIQVLQAPHISAADDAAMTRLEAHMASSEASARSALKALAGLLPNASRARLDAATAAFERFRRLNAQIIALSRRNSNVHSLALSLGRQRMLAARCEESLQALQDALRKRATGGTR